jgi:hypothetical protein
VNPALWLIPTTCCALSCVTCCSGDQIKVEAARLLLKAPRHTLNIGDVGSKVARQLGVGCMKAFLYAAGGPRTWQGEAERYQGMCIASDSACIWAMDFRQMHMQLGSSAQSHRDWMHLEKHTCSLLLIAVLCAASPPGCWAVTQSSSCTSAAQLQLCGLTPTNSEQRQQQQRSLLSPYQQPRHHS